MAPSPSSSSTRRFSQFIVPALTFAAGCAATAVSMARPAAATPTEESPYAVIAQLGRVLVEVENEYVEPVERGRLINGAIKGMVAELDPHSSYLPPQDFALFQNDTEGKFGGVGIEVDARDNVLTVIAPIEGSPAERAGIRSGDHIVAVDGLDSTNETLDKVMRKMRGVPGTHVRLSVRRDGTPQLLTFDLVREEIHVPSVAARMLEGNVAYIRVKQFQDHSHDELVAAAGRLRTEANGDIRGVILDLRTNPGGLVDEAAEIADEFLSSGTIYTTRHRGQIIDDMKAKSGGAFSDAPIVLLVNEYSASASELVAGALQDQKRALVVGARTFGKGSVQSIISLPGGAGLKLTTARYYTPSGHAVQGDGIRPDVSIETTRVEGGQLPVVRERDLEGALAPEGTSNDGDAGTALSDGDAGRSLAEADTMRSDARNVPRDPTHGKDFVLRVGYVILRTLVGRGPTVR